MALPARIVLASGNAGKLREIARILGSLEVEIIRQSELGVTEADETGIADDSGLVVDALDGRPGVYSARYAGPNATDDENIDKLLDELANVADADRTASFHCYACYVSPDDSTSLIAEGRWDGRILRERRGEAGFGYDPVFFDPECGRTAAELGAELKNARSHRGKALAALAGMMRQRFT